MNIDFEYPIGTEVKIKSLDIFGNVVGFYYGETGKQYQVAYFYNGEMKTVYLYKFQIDIPTSGNVGFAK